MWNNRYGASGGAAKQENPREKNNNNKQTRHSYTEKTEEAGHCEQVRAIK